MNLSKWHTPNSTQKKWHTPYTRKWHMPQFNKWHTPYHSKWHTPTNKKLRKYPRSYSMPHIWQILLTITLYSVLIQTALKDTNTMSNSIPYNVESSSVSRKSDATSSTG